MFEAAPHVAAGLAFAAGALTLIAVATPALPRVRGLDLAERLISDGTDRQHRRRGADGLATSLRPAHRRGLGGDDGAVGFRLPLRVAAARRCHDDDAAGVSAVALLLVRRAFYRHSRLVDLAPDARVALAGDRGGVWRGAGGPRSCGWASARRGPPRRGGR
ncbi:MAG: hypothetical protein R3C16_12480 [Hyphomonadaceae bacterium]